MQLCAIIMQFKIMLYIIVSLVPFSICEQHDSAWKLLLQNLAYY